MSRATWIAGTLAAIAAGAGGYWAGRDGLVLPDVDVRALVSTVQAQLGLEQPTAAPSVQPAKASTGPVIYYRDPDEKPFY
jgi:Cu(I)/Ag(I) efflux system membrane fusion protein